jgi:hypothetical protein
MEGKPKRVILPAHGIWTVEDLALYLAMQPHVLIQKLTDNGIKMLTLSNRSKHKLVRLEDLKAKMEA